MLFLLVHAVDFWRVELCSGEWSPPDEYVGRFHDGMSYCSGQSSVQRGSHGLYIN